MREGIKYCQKQNIHSGVILSLWRQNINEDIIQYQEVFRPYSVSKLNIHFGSIESAEGRIKHLK